MFDRLVSVYESYRNRDAFWVGVIFATSALVMMAIPLFGIPEGYDVPQHLRFAATFRDALSDGQLIPSWASIDNHGFGSVGTRFYPPVADYLLALTQSVTSDWYSSFWITSFLWMFVGGIGIYVWIRDFQDKEIAAAGAIVYALIPYRLLEIYQFVLFSEFAASAVLPFCFWAASRVIRRGRRIDVLLLSISFSALILTHIPTTLIGSMALMVYCLVLIDRTSFWRSTSRLAGAVLLSVAATSFYWIRLVTEVNWVKHSTAQYSSGFYDYRRHFFPIYLSFGQWYWQRLLWLLDLTVLLTIVFILPVIAILASKKIRDRLLQGEFKFLLALTTSAFVMVFMLTIPSGIIWSVLPFLEKVQFPWRFLSAASMLGSFLFVSSIPLLASHYHRVKKLIGYSVVAFLLTVFLFDLTQTILPAAPVPPEKFAEKLADMRNEEGCSCWWPIWADDGAFTAENQVNAGDRPVTVHKWDREVREFSVLPGSPVEIKVATFYYPYWFGEVNGRYVPVSHDEHGLITLSIPSEGAEVAIRFIEPAFVRVAQLVSIISWIVILLSLFATRKKASLELSIL